MENRIYKSIKAATHPVLNVYFTAGHPTLDSTSDIIVALDKSGVDLIEIGMPYSDPLADGPTIQGSSQQALKNGMNIALMLNQIQLARQATDVPIIVMGYYNQMLQYGEDRFLNDLSESGVDGLILPDLPMPVYQERYRQKFQAHGLGISFLVTPQTSEERIKKATELSSAFLYVVANSSITGGTASLDTAYLDKVNELRKSHPALIGFGIKDKHTFNNAVQYADGCIIGSAFIRHLSDKGHDAANIDEFVSKIRP